MQHTGVLRNWHDDRGFGFIAPTQGGPEIFVHIGAFPRDGTRPVVGERLGYELAPGRDGKKQAINVTRLAVGAAQPTVALGGGGDRADPAPRRAPTQRRNEPDRSGSSALGTIAVVVVIVVLGAWGYRQYTTSMHRKELAAQPANRAAEPLLPAAEPPPRTPSPVARPAAPVTQTATGTFTCDGRTHCSQMSSCAEATWFINHCPGTKMDSDGDGLPCEQQCGGLR